MSHLIFKNPGQLSVLDLTTMGDSSKRGDDSKIGTFDSGLKYALAILYRHDCNVKIDTGDRSFTLSEIKQKDNKTGKEKTTIELIDVPRQYEEEDGCDLCIEDHKEEFTFENSNYNCYGCRCDEAQEEYIESETEYHTTAFSTQLGFNWDFWMSIRELWSNCIDEGGEWLIRNDFQSDDYDSNFTVISIEINEHVKAVIDNWHKYFLDDELENYSSDNRVKIIENPDNYLKIYKQGILVYSDEELLSLFSYDILNCELDEARNLIDFYSIDVDSVITFYLTKKACNYLLANITEDHFEYNQLDYRTNFGNTFIECINEEYAKNGKLRVPEKMKQQFSKNEKVKIGEKTIPVEQSVYPRTVKVVDPPKLDLTLIEQVEELARSHNFKIDHPIVEKSIHSNFNCIADTIQKRILIDSEFKSEDFWQLIKAQFRLIGNGIESNDLIYQEYAKLLTNK